MADLKNKIKTVFGRKAKGGFFYIALSVSLILSGWSHAHAAPKKKERDAQPARQFRNTDAAIVVDPNRSVIFAKNQDVKLPPASTTKLVTAMVVLDRLNPDARIMISPRASKVPSISPKLRTNEVLTVNDLLHIALIKSSNSSASALAEEVSGSEELFAEEMNRKAQSIGAVNTRFANASGLPEGEQYTTVYDLTVIMNEALKYPLIKEILGKKECSITTPEGRTYRLRNTNKLLWHDDNMIGGKTGFTNSARHCFVGAFQTDAGPVYTAVLGTNSRSRLWQSTEFLSVLGNVPQRITAFKERTVVSKHKATRARHARYKKKRPVRHISRTNQSNPTPSAS